MAPGDQSNAGSGLIRLLTNRENFTRRFGDRRKNDFNRDFVRIIQSAGNFLRVDGDLFQRFGPVKVLAAGDKPDFKLFQIKHAVLQIGDY